MTFRVADWDTLDNSLAFQRAWEDNLELIKCLWESVSGAIHGWGTTFGCLTV